MITNNLFRVAALALPLAIVASLPARAQQFPERPITILVGLAAGGITDVSTRIFGETVSKNIGQRVLIENRVGAGGAVAAAAVQNAAPDGYTLGVFSASQHAAVPAMQASTPYDPLKYSSVAILFNIAQVLVVPADSPAKSVAEFLELGRKKEGGLLFGSPGSGTPSHMLAARLSAATKTPMQHVHYRGGSAIMADLITGRVDFSLSSYTAAKAQVLDKKLKVLAIDLDKRWDELPDVPTLVELGYAKQRVATWFGLAAPPGTPKAIVDRLNAEFLKAAIDPELKRRLSENGTIIQTSTPAEMQRLLEEEVKTTAQIVNELGLREKP